MTDTQVTWLTQEAFDRLKAELDQLIANRPVIAAEINDRREEGDLRENGGYHAAREEQGQQEARIRQLQELLNKNLERNLVKAAKAFQFANIVLAIAAFALGRRTSHQAEAPATAAAAIQPAVPPPTIRMERIGLPCIA